MKRFFSFSRVRFRRCSAFCLAALLFGSQLGCGGEASDDGGAGSGGSQPSGSGQIVATEDNNYAFVSTLTLDEIAVAPRTELTFDWSAVTTDFVGHDLRPNEDVVMMAVIIWKLSAEELAIKLNADELKQSDFEGIAMFYNDDAMATSAQLFDLTEFGVEIDQSILLDYLDPSKIDPATHAYTAMASSAKDPGKQTRMIQAFRPDPAATNTVVTLRPDSAELDYEVDLTSLTPVEVPAGDPNLTIDWSQIAKNALGGDFDPTAIYEVMVGKFSQSVEELETRFLDLDLIAAESDLYRGDVTSGSSFSLAETETESGAGFPGIDDSGTWLLGLICGDCTNPAPWYLTVLVPAGEAP